MGRKEKLIKKWEEKKKLKSNFLSIVWFEESQKKIERTNARKT